MSIDFGADIYEEPLVAKTFLNEDAGETSLRPRTLAEYIGQEKAKQNLSIFIEAARRRTESLDHVLLHGPPGLGKTTLAGIIAQEMGVNIRITSGPAIEKPGDLAALLTNLNEGDILFVDEIHRLNRQVEELTSGAIPGKAMSTSLSIGVACSVGMAMLRVLTGISIYYILVPGYLAALGLTFCVPKIFTGIAFDSGGVASGPMTTTFLLPFAMGACEALGGNVMTDAFGIVAMVAMTPLLTIQVLGLIYKKKQNSEDASDVSAEDEDSIIVLEGAEHE